MQECAQYLPGSVQRFTVCRINKTSYNYNPKLNLTAKKINLKLNVSVDTDVKQVENCDLMTKPAYAPNMPMHPQQYLHYLFLKKRHICSDLQNLHEFL